MEAARSTRSKKVSKRMSTVTDEDKTQAVNARLEALENDDNPGEEVAAGSDDEFQLEDSDEELTFGDSRKRRKKKGTQGSKKRKTRAAHTEVIGPKNFATLLEEADLESLPEGQPSYLTAAAGPPSVSAPRNWCSVCGFAAPYKCVRCSSRFCCRKCYTLHSETRCLKFTT